MDTQSCITNKLWIGYSTKTLSQPETDLILNHVGICELCADIKEGIDAMKHPETLSQSVDSINYKVGELLKPKRNKGLLFYWRAAAVLVFGMSVGWLFLKNQNPVAVQSENFIKKENKRENSGKLAEQGQPNISNVQKETIPLASNDNFIFSPDVINDKEDRSRGRMAIKENNLDNMAVENDERKMPDTINYTFKMPADTQSGGVTLAYDYRKNNVDVNSEAPVGEKLELEVTKSKNEDIAMVETKALKKDKLEKRKQTVSANPAPMNNSNVSNSDLLINKNSSDSINFGMANINFNKNNLDKCLEFLKTIIANSASMYYEDGLFLKAKVLVKQNKIKEAKAVLNTVILLNGIRKTEAEVLLKGLK